MRNTIASIFSIIGIVLLLSIAMIGCPQYKVYVASKHGEAELSRATYNRQVKVLEAKADYEAAMWHQQRDTVQARGIAWSNAIIGNSLKNNEPYLIFRWIENLKEISGKGQVIYVPGGLAPLPIMEAMRLKGNDESPVLPPEEGK